MSLINLALEALIERLNNFEDHQCHDHVIELFASVAHDHNVKIHELTHAFVRSAING